MSARLSLGNFDVEFALYTTEGTFYQPTAWTLHGTAATATGLVNGEGGERREAPASNLIVETVATAPDTVRFRVSARHDQPIKAVKFALDLPYATMLAPEQIDLEEATWRQWDFPAFWRTGFAVWRAGPRHFTVSTQEFPWRFRRVRALRAGPRMRLEVIQDAAARERSEVFHSSTWEIGYRHDVDALLEEHAGFVAQAYGALDFDRRRDAPNWLRRVGLVVNLHGTDWNGLTNLDFVGMTRAAEVLAEKFPGDRTILYPIGWDGRYMRAYPDYQPSPGLGGTEGFRSFCRRARELGFHIMPHLNAMAVNMRHPSYLQHLKDYVLRDASGVFQHSYKIDWDHDGLGDAAHAYIALHPPGLRRLLLAAIGRLVRECDVDAVFLDETCNVFYNDPAWDQVDGLRTLIREIREAHPDLLVAGEEWNEMLLGLTPLVQIWEETADGRRGFGRERSPLQRRWAGRFVRSCGYLALASPDGHTGVHEWPDRPWQDERENEAFYIPTLSLTRESLERGETGVDATVARAQDYVTRFAAE